ncbi:hypothetical protein C1645_831233 [Glomus cerebriforme]|uniref:Uncharacterized protein n=1 Tax=Glomus cerebriforme TaxID=658196 RepID=A0A397SFX4_9GLOM|nr:hypothetical protein C1645_831233 [Glomus cerebriforme]
MENVPFYFIKNLEADSDLVEKNIISKKTVKLQKQKPNSYSYSLIQIDRKLAKEIARRTLNYCNLNDKDFIITVLQNNENEYKPGFQCICKNISLKIEPYLLTAINSYYKEVFETKTEHSDITVIGFEDEKIIKQLFDKIEFFLIFLQIEKLLVVILDLGYSSKDGYYGAKKDFTSFFII